MGLPDMDGIAVCRTIRGWSDVPIIILSATGAENRKVAALDAGANDYVTKPFSMPELEARIRVVTRGRDVDRDDTDPPRSTCVRRPRLDLVHHDVALERRQRRAHDQGVRGPRLLGPSRRQDLHAPDDPRAPSGERATAPRRSTSTPTCTDCVRN